MFPDGHLDVDDDRLTHGFHDYDPGSRSRRALPGSGRVSVAE
jgi:hypothetical protein